SDEARGGAAPRDLAQLAPELPVLRHDDGGRDGAAGEHPEVEREVAVGERRRERADVDEVAPDHEDEHAADLAQPRRRGARAALGPQPDASLALDDLEIADVVLTVAGLRDDDQEEVDAVDGREVAGEAGGDREREPRQVAVMEVRVVAERNEVDGSRQLVDD